MKRHLISKALALGASVLILAVAGCSTVETRIAEKPEAYRRLGPADQERVAQGKIRRGMPEDAVYIAWGEPNQRAEGRDRGRPVETWIYFNTTSSDYYSGPFLYGSYTGFGYGYGYGGGYGYSLGRRHHFSGFYYDPFFDPFFYNSVSVVSYPERTVSFRNGRVIAYQYLPMPRYF